MPRLLLSSFYFTIISAALGPLLSNRTFASPDEVDLPPPADREVDFARDIQPLFAKHCHACHGPEKQESDLRLDLKESTLEGGVSGPAFELGKSEESLLIELVAGLDPGFVMPPKGDRLTPEEVGLLRAWIDQGARWEEAQSDESGQQPTAASDH